MVSVPQSEIENNVEVQRLAEQLRRTVDSLIADDTSFAEREEVTLTVTNEAARQVLQQALQTLERELGNKVVVDGVLYREHERGEHVDYHSLCGALHVPRSTYRRVGERNGPTIVPLELSAGLMERATPALARSVAQGYAKHDMRSHEEDLVQAARVPPSRSTLETIAKRIAMAVAAETPRVEPAVRQGEQLPAEATGIVVGLDRTSTPMEEARPAGVPPKTRRKKRTTPYRRSVPAPVDVNYRMAFVATFAVVDEQGEALLTRRYSASPAHGADGLVGRLMADVRQALSREPGLHVGVMQDGAPELWNLIRPALDAEASVSSWQEGIDVFHLYEHLSDALKCVERRPARRKAILDEWAKDLQRRDSAIDVIENFLVKRYDSAPASKAADLWQELVYIRNNKDRMRYVTLRVRGLPVGSGVTEGAAKSVVGKRAKRGGQRWHDDNLDTLLNLRAIYCSDRLPRVWNHFSRRYTARVDAIAT